ncbi:hypothetical protein [Streptomyces sp. WM6386]|uniref:hypothetical protein n=1 Tax=Streptomyces sp. WM6386 TaxID=1415558 RepID=UPI000B0B42A0|nr:hypothetical protein [Streptomyces sp. WM6386]
MTRLTASRLPRGLVHEIRALQQIQARTDAAGDIDWLGQIDSTIVRLWAKAG